MLNGIGERFAVLDQTVYTSTSLKNVCDTQHTISLTPTHWLYWEEKKSFFFITLFFFFLTTLLDSKKKMTDNWDRTLFDKDLKSILETKLPVSASKITSLQALATAHPQVRKN